MINNGIYAAGLSILNSNKSLDIKSTIDNAESAIKKGLHGVFFFGSTGQSQLLSISEKKDLISKSATSKFKNQFYFGTGSKFFKRQPRSNSLQHGVWLSNFFNYATRILQR